MCLQYVEWATGTNNTDLFFSNAQALQLYQNHLNVTANRVNSISGVVYKNDPTIFAWDLLNEPRCTCYPSQTTNLATLPASCQPSCADSITVSRLSVPLPYISTQRKPLPPLLRAQGRTPPPPPPRALSPSYCRQTNRLQV